MITNVNLYRERLFYMENKHMKTTSNFVEMDQNNCIIRIWLPHRNRCRETTVLVSYIKGLVDIGQRSVNKLGSASIKLFFYSTMLCLFNLSNYFPAFIN